MILPPAIPDIPRVEEIKVLGVTFSWKLSVNQHVDQLLAACERSLFALHNLRNHGRQASALHATCMPTSKHGGVLQRLLKCWQRSTRSFAVDALQNFLLRSVAEPTLTGSSSDDKLFEKITSNPPTSSPPSSIAIARVTERTRDGNVLITKCYLYGLPHSRTIRTLSVCYFKT